MYEHVREFLATIVGVAGTMASLNALILTYVGSMLKLNLRKFDKMKSRDKVPFLAVGAGTVFLLYVMSRASTGILMFPESGPTAEASDLLFSVGWTFFVAFSLSFIGLLFLGLTLVRNVPDEA